MKTTKNAIDSLFRMIFTLIRWIFALPSADEVMAAATSMAASWLAGRLAITGTRNDGLRFVACLPERLTEADLTIEGDTDREFKRSLRGVYEYRLRRIMAMTPREVDA